MQQTAQMICLACRTQLIASALRRAHRIPPPPQSQPTLPTPIPQWQARASSSSSEASSSLSSLLTNDDATPTPSISELEKLQQASAQQGSERKGSLGSKSRFTKAQPKPGRLQHFNSPDSLDIFEQIVSQKPDETSSQPQSDITKESTKKKAYVASMDFYHDLAKLQAMMKKEDVPTCFDFFEAKILPNAPPVRDCPQVLKATGVRVMSSVSVEKNRDFDDKSLPSVSRITRILKDLGGLMPQKWAVLMLGLIQHISTISTSPENYATVEACQNASARKDELFRDLIESWRIFHHNIPEGFQFPTIEPSALAHHARSGNVVGGVGLLFRKFMLDQLQEVSTAALASLAILIDPAQTSQEVRDLARAFAAPLGRIFASVRVDRDTLIRMFQPYPALSPYILGRWSSVIAQLRGRTGTSSPRKDTIMTRLEFVPPKKLIADLHKRVTRALKMVDVEAIESAWSEALRITARPGENGKQAMIDNPHVFDYFIYAFTCMRRPRQAAAVWATMTSIGIQPTLLSWTSLLEGCRRARDPIALENVWQKLVASGIVLDARAWTTRITGLIECSQPEAGLKALNEMATLSKKSPRHNAAVPLTIEPINATVAGLLRLRDGGASAARKVLDWATQRGVQPDVVTFNMLLQPLVKAGETEQIEEVFEMMRKQKVDADAGTFTVMLDGLFSKYSSHDATEQKQMVTKLFDQMEATGIVLNMDTFAKMLHILLHEGSNTRASADAILDHISSKGLNPSIYIYTILVEHYFSRSPPDLEAVIKLVDVDKLCRNGNLDRVFWERVIKGYTRAGEIKRAFTVFQEVNNVGLALTLNSLEMLLRAVVKSGQMDSAKNLVDTVRQHRERFRPEGNHDANQTRFWRHGFWGYAWDCGLLTREDMQSLKTVYTHI